MRVCLRICVPCCNIVEHSRVPFLPLGPSSALVQTHPAFPSSTRLVTYPAHIQQHPVPSSRPYCSGSVLALSLFKWRNTSVP